MAKGGGSQKSTTTSKPWKAVMPYARDIMAQGQNLFQNYRPQPYPGSTVAELSPETKAALQAMWDRASLGNPLVPQAQGVSSAVLGGAGGVPDAAFNFFTGAA